MLARHHRVLILASPSENPVFDNWQCKNRIQSAWALVTVLKQEIFDVYVDLRISGSRIHVSLLLAPTD